MDFDDLDDAVDERKTEGLPEPKPFTGTCKHQDKPPLRFGVLSTSSIVDAVMTMASMSTPGIATIHAIASREPAVAKSYVEMRQGQGMLKDILILDSYQAIIDCKEVECVYNPLPNGLHFEWTMKALKAGKHVLCEKPFASNSEEAKLMVELAREKNLVCMEAMHWKYHPVRNRILDVCHSGMLGIVKEIHLKNVLRMGLKRRVLEEKGTIDPKNFTGKLWILRTEMAGGLTMTLGTYCLSLMRELMEAEPVITSATPGCLADIDEMDIEMKAEMSHPDSEVKGFLEWSGIPDKGKEKDEPFVQKLTVKGTEANLTVSDFIGPPPTGPRELSLDIRNLEGEQVFCEKVDSLRGKNRLNSYDLQLIQFVDNVHDVISGEAKCDSFENTGDELVAQMFAIDNIYVKAGMTPRSGPANIESKVAKQ